MSNDPTGHIEHRVPTKKKEIQKIAGKDSGVDWPLPRSYWREDVEDSYAAYRSDVSATVARQVDVTMVMRYFDLQEAMARVFDELLLETSFLSVNDQGTARSHPHLAMFCRLISVSISLANEIGATPMSRVKLGLYATEGVSAQIALEKAVNGDPGVKRAAGDKPIDVEVIDDEIVMKW